MALVKTGAPGVRVYQENREVAVSDAQGDALVPGLVPFAANRISVDPDDYPISTVIEASERVTVPGRYGGVVVDLAPRARSPLLVTAVLADGSFVPTGSRATLDGNTDPLVVGRNGKLFLEDLRAPAGITIDLPNGTCRFPVAPQPPSTLHRASSEHKPSLHKMQEPPTSAFHIPHRSKHAENGTAPFPLPQATRKTPSPHAAG